MAIALVVIAAGIIILKIPALKRRYFKFHKMNGLAGTVCVLAGLASAVLMVYESGGHHVGVPHAYLGILTIFGMIVTVSLGLSQFRWKAQARKIRFFHMWSGRATALLFIAAAVTGLIHAGIL